LFLATYRIAFEHWTPEQACCARCIFFIFKGFWHPSMKTYIRNFPHHFATSPAFALYRSGTLLHRQTRRPGRLGNPFFSKGNLALR
jgi:hypothetical protein